MSTQCDHPSAMIQQLLFPSTSPQPNQSTIALRRSLPTHPTFLMWFSLLALRAYQNLVLTSWLRKWDNSVFEANWLRAWVAARQHHILVSWKSVLNQLQSITPRAPAITLPNLDSTPPNLLPSCVSTIQTIEHDKDENDDECDSPSVVEACPLNPSFHTEESPDSPRPFVVPTILVTPPDDDDTVNDVFETMSLPEQRSLGSVLLTVPGQPCYDMPMETFSYSHSCSPFGDYDADESCQDDEELVPNAYSTSPLSSDSGSSFWIEEDEDDLPDLSDWET
ncbi:hypothetical protein FRB99_007915 [Tulasnella sp. 403]|nr:hypothetical protein FRB99_007915 [Tulasnella sp. 403]